MQGYIGGGDSFALCVACPVTSLGTSVCDVTGDQRPAAADTVQLMRPKYAIIIGGHQWRSQTFAMGVHVLRRAP